jgi:hypothetical protein
MVLQAESNIVKQQIDYNRIKFWQIWWITCASAFAGRRGQALPIASVVVNDH